jgi:hypothetical protein
VTKRKPLPNHVGGKEKVCPNEELMDAGNIKISPLGFEERRKWWRLSAGAQREEGVPAAPWPAAIAGEAA